MPRSPKTVGKKKKSKASGVARNAVRMRITFDATKSSPKAKKGSYKVNSRKGQELMALLEQIIDGK